MCELLGVSTAVPAAITLSINRLAARGNVERHLADGWGVALHDGGDVFLVREPEAACTSTFLPIIQNHRYRTRLAIAHIRKATEGELSLRNTQPFARELGGRMHVFAHNGHLPALVRTSPQTGSERFQPIGTTDSERAFCLLLNRLAPLWAGGMPSLADRLRVIDAVAAELRPLGPANFLYTDGDTLFAHADRRTQPDGRIVPPGLMMLRRPCDCDPDAAIGAAIDSGSGVAIESRGMPQAVVEIASVALTGEEWQPVPQGQILALRGGAILDRSPTDTAAFLPQPIGGHHDGTNSARTQDQGVLR